LEVVGTTATLQTAIDCARKGGAVTMVGNLAPEVAFPLQAVVIRELSLFGTCGSRGEYPTCLELMSRKAIRVEPLITATASLDEGAAWFDRLYRGESGVMKVILQPT
jgi:L-iditol 2-dehydrogenase